MGQNVDIERSFSVPLTTLWEYWTDAQLFATWFGPGDAIAKMTSYEVVEGKSYEVHVVEPSGVTHVTTGIFTTVKPHQELGFTWKIHDLDMEESRVTVFFTGDETQSSLRLMHSQLTHEHAQMHEFGWNAAFSKLGMVIQN